MQGSTAQLDIQDDGASVAPEHQDKLFEPFFTTDAQGTGLGLFLARELAEANHAELAYLPGAGGARFRLSIHGKATP
jgi:two-component system sensor histidine kinase PilS (NtrC family)